MKYLLYEPKEQNMKNIHQLQISGEYRGDAGGTQSGI